MNEISNGLWSESDAANNAPTPNGWPEGQPPSSVNDCARMMMGAMKRFWTRINASYATTGAANAYVLTPAVPLAAYVTGERYSFRASFANTAAATLNISGLGAKPIRKYGAAGNAALAGGDIQAGQSVTVEYDGTNMILVTPVAPAQTPQAAAPVDATYVVIGATGALAAERVATAGAGITLADGGAGAALTIAVDKATQATMEAQSANKVATADTMRWHPGVAKAWVFFSASGGAISGVNGLNIAGVSRNGIGDYTVVFATPFSSASYAAAVLAASSAAATNMAYRIGPSATDGSASQTAASFRFCVATGTAAALEVDRCALIFFGDQ